MDYRKGSLELHEKHKGKIAIASKVPLHDRNDLSIAYTPGVATPCLAIAKDPELAYKYTAKGNLVAVVSDGTAVLGLGNIGGLAGMPVMEGKAILFKEFGDVDAFPICLSTQDPDEIIKIVQGIAPTFGGINLEDIKAPECFYIEEELKKTLNIPVFHDDQHGTAVVVLAALTNALRLTHKNKQELRVVVNGAGAAGIAIAKLLIHDGVKDIIMCDTNGAIYAGRPVGMNKYKEQVAAYNIRHIQGDLATAVHESDVFIGVSKAGALTQDMVRTMRKDPFIFAMANPIPEIMPDEAKAAGAAIVGTGRSDFANQINNVLAFPGIFRGALDARAPQITEEMKVAAAHAIATYLPQSELSPEKIIPSPLDRGVAKAVALAVQKAAQQQ
jgi:malate dehydrogenase (oxaloacetate-decarboxylating)